MGKNRNSATIPFMSWIADKPGWFFFLSILTLSAIFSAPASFIAINSPKDFPFFFILEEISLGALMMAGAKWPKKAPASDKDKNFVAWFIFVGCWAFILIKCLNILGAI